VAAWNRELSLAEAFSCSAVWVFAELSRRIPRAAYARSLEAIGYGDGALGEAGPDFWNQGAFRVTPVEQLELLAALARGGLPFDARHQAFVRRCMEAESGGRGLLRQKSGWTLQDGRDIGWLVGWLECPEGRFAFATRISADSARLPADFSALRTRLSLAALDAARSSLAPP
jgi:beta-lactamase class D